MATTAAMGSDTYKGQGLPLFGDATLRKEGTSNAAITLMHSTANTTGGFIMGVDYRGTSNKDTSILTNLEVFEIDGDGGFRVKSGTTVLYELDSSGLYVKTTQIMSTDGKVLTGNYTPVSVMTTGTAVTLVSTQSGTLFWMSSKNDTSVKVNLPKNPTAGTWYDFVVSPQDATGDFTVVSTADTSANIYLPGVTSAVSSVDAIAPATTRYAGCKVIAMTSVKWIVQPFYDGGTLTTGTPNINNEDFYNGRWLAGTTAA